MFEFQKKFLIDRVIKTPDFIDLEGRLNSIKLKLIYNLEYKNFTVHNPSPPDVKYNFRSLEHIEGWLRGIHDYHAGYVGLSNVVDCVATCPAFQEQPANNDVRVLDLGD